MKGLEAELAIGIVRASTLDTARIAVFQSKRFPAGGRFR